MWSCSHVTYPVLNIIMLYIILIREGEDIEKGRERTARGAERSGSREGAEEREEGEEGAYHVNQVFKHTDVSHCTENFRIILY